jgi:hypothetical protein
VGNKSILSDKYSQYNEKKLTDYKYSGFLGRDGICYYHPYFTDEKNQGPE